MPSAALTRVFSPQNQADPVIAGRTFGTPNTASVLAAWAVTRHQPSWQTLAALLLQHAVLTISAYAAITAIEMHARRATAEVLQATLAAMDTEAEQLRPPRPTAR